MELDRYQIVREIKKGGMAEIYLASDRESGRDVALKLLMPQLAQDDEIRQRFRHEAQAHLRLKHPNVVELYDWGEGGDRPFLALEYVEGLSLADLLERISRLPPEVAIHIAREALKGLSYAHEEGLVHRDIKPSNILLSSEGDVKIADFGIATGARFTRLTQAGSVVGTPDYMSPEQARGDPPDHRTDLFAAGVMLYEMLSGTHPFHTDNPNATLRRIVDGVYRPLFEVNPAVLPELETVVDNFMEIDLRRRYQSASDALGDLETVQLALRRAELDRDSLAVYLANPAGETARRAREISEVHLHRADTAFRGGTGSATFAAWELYLATWADPGHAEAKDRLESILRGHELCLQAPSVPKLDRLRQLVAKNPDTPAFLLNLASAYMAERAVVDSMVVTARLFRLNVRDESFLEMVAEFFGEEHLAAVDRSRTLVPRRHARTRRRTTTRMEAVTPTPVPATRSTPDAPPPTTFEAALITPADVILIGLGGLMIILALSMPKVPQLLMVGAATFLLGFSLRPLLMLRWQPSELFEKGQAQLKLGSYGQAEMMLRRFRRWFPEHPRAGLAALGLGRALAAQGRAMEALEILYLGLGKMEVPARIDAHRLRCRIMLNQGRREAAMDEYRSLVQTNDPVAAPAAALNLAELLREEERYEEALEEIDNLIHDFPRSVNIVDAMLLRGELLLDVGRGYDALKVVKDIQDRVPERSEAHKAADELASRISQANAPATDLEEPVEEADEYPTAEGG